MWMHLWETTTLQEMQIARKLKPIREYTDKDICDINISKVGDLLLTLPEDSNLYIDRKNMTFSKYGSRQIYYRNLFCQDRKKILDMELMLNVIVRYDCQHHH